MKYFVWGLFITVYLYACAWIFNHGWPWVGIGFGLVGIAIVIRKVEKFIKNKQY